MKRAIVLVHNTTHYLYLHYRELVEALHERGWQVTCVAPADDAVPLLEELGARCLELDLSRRGLNPFREVATVMRLAASFRRLRPDAVLNFSIKPAIYGSIAARLAGVSTICSMITGMGYVFLGAGRFRRLLASAAGAAYRVALKYNHRVFFQNPDDARFFTEHGLITESKAVVLAGTGIDTRRFTPRVGNAPDGRTRFLMVTRLLTDKGVREFVTAARLLQERGQPIHCAILGPRDDNPAAVSKSELEDWIRNGAVDYLGETADVAPYLANCDVFVLPSYREGLPRANLEAMAMGKPVITTDVPGCRETVEVGINGLLVPPRDPESLARAMEELVDRPELIEEMGRASREITVRKFEVHKINDIVIGEIEDGFRVRP